MRWLHFLFIFIRMPLLCTLVLNIIYQCIGVKLINLLICQFTLFCLLLLVPLFLYLLKSFIKIQRIYSGYFYLSLLYFGSFLLLSGSLWIRYLSLNYLSSFLVLYPLLFLFWLWIRITILRSFLKIELLIFGKSMFLEVLHVLINVYQVLLYVFLDLVAEKVHCLCELRIVFSNDFFVFFELLLNVCEEISKELLVV